MRSCGWMPEAISAASTTKSANSFTLKPPAHLRLTAPLSGGQLKKPRRILLQDQRPHLGLDRQLVELLHPTLGRDHGVVRAEQDLLLQQRVGILDQERWEILRRPPGEIDVDLRLVRRHRE